eukprot:CAMPEP_0182418282 /NCGR_PEP_ID=MMETSP1167-20130531/2760_1 /TAXON_ID=2988 /ORGANISM="Mallomonas Sp, Strain CCMP3275" /LENGTH=454 /DNA_ID=CAMNT_0024592425 /DNA_START=82 /DNA_END=1446 /DNA_ORIENTATION=+
MSDADFFGAFGAVYNLFKQVIMLRFPHSSLFIYACHATFSATKVKHYAKKDYFWFYSLVYVVLTAVAGGSASVMLLGKMPAIVTNDLVVVCSIVMWFLTHRCGMQKYLMTNVGHLTWGVGAAMYRTNAICTVTHAAAKMIPAGYYYPIPLMGPIVCGACTAMSTFIPFDKGMAPIATEIPWPVQGAIFCSAFYHFAVHDTTGPIGGVLRLFVGAHTDESARMVVGLIQIGTVIIHVYLGHEYSMLTPIIKAYNLIFQYVVEETSKKDEKGWSWATIANYSLSASRVFIVLLAVATQLYMQATLPTTLHVGRPLSLSLSSPSLLGSCQIGSGVRGCSPHILSVINNDSGTQLQVASKTTPASVSWSLPLSLSLPSSELTSSSLSLRLGNDGALRLFRSSNDNTDELLWTSSSSCSSSLSALSPSLSSKKSPILKLHEISGLPLVTCPAGDVVIVA